NLGEAFFFLARKGALDAAGMHRASEAPPDATGQLRRAQGLIFGSELLQECHYLGVELVGAPRPGLLGHQGSEAAALEDGPRLIERRAREAEGRRALVDALPVHAHPTQPRTRSFAKT